MQWADFWPFQDRQSDQPPIDMGNGRVLAAEDLLEGHFHRLAAGTVQVQVKRDMQAAITVVAPQLAPLTEVAREVAQAVPVAQPAARFRHDLHKALELTHRQQAAQRKLGTRPAPAESHWGALGLVIAGVVLLIGVVVYLRRRQNFYTQPNIS
jgi:hypothetical protein